MIEITGLNKEVRNNNIAYMALSDINLNVRKGEFVSIYGPSGSGKTSLVNILGMLDLQTSGDYLFNDISIKDLSKKQRLLMRRDVLAFITKEPKLLTDLNVYENVELPLVYQNVSKQKRKEKVMTILNDVKLLHKSKSKINELSIVQKQKVTIARALVVKPLLVIADEPTGILNSTDSSEIIELLNKINEMNITIALFTHNSDLAKVGSRVIQMHDGHLVAESVVG